MTRPDSDAAPYEPVLEQTAQAWLVRTGVPTMSPRRDRSPNGSWPMAPT